MPSLHRGLLFDHIPSTSNYSPGELMYMHSPLGPAGVCKSMGYDEFVHDVEQYWSKMKT